MFASLRITRPRYLALFAFEGALVLAVLYGLALLTGRLIASTDVFDLRMAVVLTGGMFLAVLVATQTATLGARAKLNQEIVLFSILCFMTGSVLFAALWLVSADLKWLPVLLSIEGALAVPLAVAVWRWISVRFNVLDVARETVLIVGAGETAKQLCRWISDRRADAYAVLGFAAEDDSQVGSLLAAGVRVQTDYASMLSYGLSRVQRVIVALDEKRGKLPVKELMELRLLGVEIEEATTFYERESGRIAVETMLPSWLIFSDGFKTSAIRSLLKRTTDVVHSLILLVLAAPAMLFTAVLIKLDSRGPVFYRQSRMGRFGEEFFVLKFRSMRHDAERSTGPTWAQSDDPRVTRVGRIIRKLRIDELPQLINVLRGQMSFVGPRPERAFFVKQLEEKIPYFGLRMTVRPGITGWAQVEYGYSATDEDALEKLKYDLFYVKNNNIIFDLWIVIKTIKVVLSGHGAR